jgi:hypothetical protein
MDQQQANALDFFLRQSAVYGLAFVFLAGVLMLLLWVAWSTVSVLKTWLPKWFQSQIRAQKQVGVGINRLSKFILMMYRKNSAANEATVHMVTAMDIFFSRNKERYSVPPETLFHIQSAKKALQRQDDVDYFDGMEEDDPEGVEEKVPDDLDLRDAVGGDSGNE